MPRIAGSIDGDRLDQLRGGRGGVGEGWGTMVGHCYGGAWLVSGDHGSRVAVHGGGRGLGGPAVPTSAQ